MAKPIEYDEWFRQIEERTRMRAEAAGGSEPLLKDDSPALASSSPRRTPNLRCPWQLVSYTNGKLVRCHHETGHTRIDDGTLSADHHSRHDGFDIWWNEAHPGASPNG
jgi:hypothetical protein